MLAFTLPLGVSVNVMYIVTSRGVRLTEAAKKFKRDATTIARIAGNRAGWQMKAANTPLFLHMKIYFPNDKRCDISNFVKVAEDSIADALGFDDRYIHKLLVERAGIDKHNPRCEVVLEVLR